MPENMARLSETFSRAHEIMDSEKKVVLGKRSFLHMLFAKNEPSPKKRLIKPHCVPFAGLSHHLYDIYDSPVYKTNIERMQGFFCTLYDNW